ncbi:MAG: glycosyltransferase, partial [Erysipelotrichales bacterium]|nr:glycosyltransferase [Erysipelotrichales bacterium]
QGFEVVNARRVSRDGETFMKKFTAKMFYKIIAKANKKINIPENVGNYRLISKKVVESLNQLREKHRFTRGLISWAGYKTCIVDFHRESRVAGVSKYNWKGMINYAIEGFTSFTTTPLRFSIYLGVGTSLGSVLYFLLIVVASVLNWMIDFKFHISILIMLILFSLQAILIGILGEYLARVFDETKFRPMYFIQEIINGK